MYRKFFKRFLDIILSFTAIIILSPVYMVVSILVFIFMGHPIIFKQKRPGKNEKIFNMYKFRTMTNEKDKEGNLLPDEKRLNKFGRFLRKTSLDELPELFLIFVGKMSIVGPRPLLVKYLPYYTEIEHHRHDIRPGLTGLAQVSGRNLVSWDDKFKLDLDYIKKITFIGDVKILVSTIRTVIKREGITDKKTETMTFLDEERKDMFHKKVVIIGASGHARVIADIIKLSGDEIVGYLDDNDNLQGCVIFDDKKVLGTINEENIFKYKEYYYIVGIGNNKVRQAIVNRYPDLKWYNAIHPNAVIANNVNIGKGNAIMAGVVINTGTLIGNHCVINTSVSLDHDNVLEDYVHISPGAHLAGKVIVGECTWIGTGAAIINNITIAKNNVIGAGATVIADIVESENTYVGVPVRRVKKQER